MFKIVKLYQLKTSIIERNDLRRGICNFIIPTSLSMSEYRHEYHRKYQCMKEDRDRGERQKIPKCSSSQGNMFTGVCLSIGGVPGPGGA